MRLVFSFVLIVNLLTSDGGNARHVIGPLRDRNPAWRCGCAFSTPGDRKAFVFAHPFGRGPAWINIDGKDVKLTLINPVGDANDWSEKNPIGTTLTYKGAGLRVKVIPGKLTSCPPKDESCEGVGVEAVLVIQGRGLRKSLNVVGACGC